MRSVNNSVKAYVGKRSDLTHGKRRGGARPRPPRFSPPTAAPGRLGLSRGRLGSGARAGTVARRCGGCGGRYEEAAVTRIPAAESESSDPSLRIRVVGPNRRIRVFGSESPDSTRWIRDAGSESPDRSRVPRLLPAPIWG